MSDKPKPRNLMNGDLPNDFTFEPRFETHRLVQVEVQGALVHWPRHYDVFFRLTESTLYVAECDYSDPAKGPEVVDLRMFPRALAVMQFEPRKKEEGP